MVLPRRVAGEGSGPPASSELVARKLRSAGTCWSEEEDVAAAGKATGCFHMQAALVWPGTAEANTLLEYTVFAY